MGGCPWCREQACDKLFWDLLFVCGCSVYSGMNCGKSVLSQCSVEWR